ncbi:type II toxin-antitoxin system VapC family toxin [Brachybacterium paraconglomeratum]|uniref:type II toxin-antitoxin system VapC family toxin n=1 Tax=Brachybacterium paraconglomeratum TaxID=173362 RepID=UPI0037CC8B8F
MRYLLDTNVLSDARAKRTPELMAWLEEQPMVDLRLSAITLLELERGVRRKERTDPVGAGPLRRWLEEDVRATFARRVLPVDDDVAVAAAALHVPDPMPEMDALIAGTALVHGLTLVTRNIKDVTRVPVALFDPWTR